MWVVRAWPERNAPRCSYSFLANKRVLILSFRIVLRVREHRLVSKKIKVTSRGGTLYLNQCYREIKRSLAVCPSWRGADGLLALGPLSGNPQTPGVTRMTGHWSPYPVVKCPFDVHSPSILVPVKTSYAICVYIVNYSELMLAALFVV